VARMARSDSISVKRLGAVEAAVVSAGQLRNWATDFRPDQAWITRDTDVDADGRAIGGLNWLLVRSGDAVVLIDPATGMLFGGSEARKDGCAVGY